MKIRAIGNYLLLFCSFCLVWSSGSRQLRAGQSYPSQVTVFPHSSTATGTSPSQAQVLGDSSAATADSQQVDPTTEADVRHLMDLVGTKAMVERMMSSLEVSMKPLMLGALPPGPYRERLVQLFFEKFHTKMDAQHVLDLAIPVYARNFSDDEIKGLIQFYNTPLGQKWISLAPKMQAELLPAARSWGKEMGRQSMMEVLQEHPDLAQELKAAAQAAHSQKNGEE